MPTAWDLTLRLEALLPDAAEITETDSRLAAKIAIVIRSFVCIFILRIPDLSWQLRLPLLWLLPKPSIRRFSNPDSVFELNLAKSFKYDVLPRANA